MEAGSPQVARIAGVASRPFSGNVQSNVATVVVERVHRWFGLLLEHLGSFFSADPT